MNTDNQDIEKLPEAVIRFYQKLATEEDIKELHLWLEQNAGNQRLFDEYFDVWLSASQLKQSNDFDSEKAWDKLIPSIKSGEPIQFEISTQQKFGWKKYLQIAAIVVVALMLGGLSTTIYNSFQKPKTGLALTEHSVPYGSKSIIVLPDGTKIWLNAGSRLVYSQAYNLTSREVHLTGEAFFDVKKNSKMPFWVYTPFMKVKVTGTSFNIKAYPQENSAETIVEKGTVEVFNADNNGNEQKTVLNPQQKAVITCLSPQTKQDSTKNSNLSISQVEDIQNIDLEPTNIEINDKVNVQLYTSWKDKRWIIEKEELGSLAIKLGRRYDITIKFEGEALKRYVFSGALEDESLDQVLKVIQLTAPIEYSLHKKDVILREDIKMKDYLKKQIN